VSIRSQTTSFFDEWMGIYTYDGNGNITAWIDAAGTVVATQRYDAFGNIIQQTGTPPSNYGFSTKPQEKVTGLLYYGLRYYEPITGRWPNRDPIGEDGGMNMYGFVSNDGVGKWDYLGNIIISDEGEEYRKKVKESLEKITGAKLKWEPHTTKTECKDIDENKLWILVEENTGKGEGKLYNDLMEGINAPEKNNGAADKGVQALIIIIKQEKDGVANLTGACCDVASRIRRLHLHDKADADMTSSSDETIKSGFDGLLWHELVGHGIKGLKHPTGRDNVEEVRRKNIEKGKEVPLNPDPVIQIENQARSKLGTPLRYPTYDKTLEDQRSR
jgi:RHS repeat-associated protein